jgi:PAS domain S-box-containing protein
MDTAGAAHPTAQEIAALRRLARLTRIGAWEYDVASERLFWTEETYRLHELEPAALTPTIAGAIGFFAPEAQPLITQALREGIEHGRRFDLELPLVTARGRRLWVRAIGEAELADGHCVRLAGTLEDVSAARQAREALRARTDEAHKLALVAEHTSDLVIITDAQHRIEWVNASFERVTGYAAAEVLGKTPRELLNRADTEDNPEYQDLRRRVLAGHGVTGAELKLYRKDGTPYWVELEQRPVRDETGAIRHFIHIQRDITVRRAARQREHELAQRLRLVSATTGIGTFQRDLDSGAGIWDEATFRLFGFAPAPQPPPLAAVLARVHADDRARYRDYLDAIGRDGEAQDVEFRVVYDDGRVGYLLERGSLEPGAGVRRVAIGVVLDVTGQRSAERQALAAAEQLALAVGATGVGFCFCSADGGTIEFDAQARALLGLGAHETKLSRRQFESMVVADDRPLLARLRADRLLAEGPTEAAFRVVRRDGARRWLRMRCAVAPSLAAGESRVLCKLIDITADKQQQVQHQLQRERLALAIGAAGIGTWEIDLVSGRGTWSDEMRAIHGLAPGEPVPSHDEWRTRFVHAEDRAQIDDVRRLRASAAALDREFRIVRRDGALRWLHSRLAFVPGSGDEHDRVVGVSIDVTERKLAEQRASEMAGWLELATRSIGIGRWYRDLRDPLPTWDEQMFRIFGLDPAAGTPTDDAWQAMILPEDRAQFVGVDIHAPPPGATLAFSYRIRRPDGEVRYLQSRRSSVYGSDGRLLRVYGAVMDVTDTRTASEALSEARDRLSLAAEVGAIASWERNLETGEGRWDPLLFRFYGLQPAPVVPPFSRVLEMVHPEDREKFRRNWQRVLESDGTVEMETRVVHPDGKVVVLVTRARADRRADGTPWRIIGATIDATALHEARRERDALAERMQIIADSVGIGVWDWDPAAHVTVWNDRMYELFGHSREWFTDKHWLDVIHPDDRADAEAALKAALASGDRFEAEFRVVWADASVHWIASRGRIQRDAAGRVVRAIGVNIDISERRRAEQAARDLLDRVRLTTAATGIGLWELDLATQEMHWDEQTYRLAGRTPADLGDLRDSWTQVIHPDDMPMMRAAQKRALKELQPFDLEARIVWPCGEVRYVVLRGQLRLDERGRPVKQFGVVFDVTERKLAESAIRAKETAERANQAKTEFLSRMSHELRTPLNAILGFTQILELDQQHPLAPAQRERVRHIQQAGWHLLALINEILDLSRIESGKANLALAAVPLADVIDECLTLVAPEAVKRGIEIAVQRSADAPTAAWADRTRVKQVLLNLLSNAVKYNRERGSVRIALGADAEGNALIAVRDTGHGLSARQIDQLFQPFNRLGLESAPIQGTGIGLALSLKLIEQMGGKLEVSSELQVGTEFRVTLPAASAGTQAPEAQARSSADAPRDDVRGGVLYVEDNPENVAIVEQMLALRPQVKLFTAVDGATARVLAAVCQPDLILLDMRLPDTDGLALFRELRAQPETKHIPCVALSANALPADAAHARAAGFADYWTKPLNAAQFLRGIDALLARP